MLARRENVQRVVLGALGWLVLACPGDDGPEPSDDAPAIEPDCRLTDPLTLELGEGQSRFEAIAADGEPSVHYGPQGGTHLILAARLHTPDPLDRYEVAVRAELGEGSCMDGDCERFVSIAEITDVIQGTDSVQLGDGMVDIPSLFVVLDDIDGWLSSPVRRVSLEVADACDRRASVVRTFVLPP